MDPGSGPHDDAPTQGGIGAPPEIPELEVQLAMRSMMASMLGRVPELALGRYQVRQRLGQGGCGLVLLAHDPKLDREVAIKIVLPARDRDLGPGGQRALQREAQALARLEHPNVVEVFDAGTAEYGGDSGGTPRSGVYVVMERLRGRTMRQWLAQAKPGWREILDVHLQIARGLRAAHAAGIVHRDCKPDNVLLTDDGRAVLIDFGLADETVDLAASDTRSTTGVAMVLDDSDDGIGSSGSGEFTRRTRVVGTPLYMAPEQHEGHPVGPAADQYAWCVSLFAALFGAPPFVGDSMAELAACKRRGRVPPPTSGPPRALHRALRRGLAPDPSARFPDMDALLVAVEAAVGPRRRSIAWVAAAGATAIVATASFAGLRERHPCDASPPELASVWSPERRTEISGTLASLPDPHAAALGAGVGDRLDAFAERWLSAYDEVCATEAAPAIVTSRLECLGRTATQLDHVASAFGAMAIEDVDHATALLEGLRTPSDCVAADAMPPEHREELAQMWRKIDALGVEVDARGEFTDPDWPGPALVRADELGDAALASTIAHRLGQVARAAGRLEEAEQHMRTAVFRAAAAHDYARALKLMPSLVLSVGSDLGDREGALGLVEHAKLMAAHVDDPRHDLAAIDDAIAYLEIEKGDNEAAIAIYRRSAATFEAVGRPSSEYARCLLAMSGWAVEQGDTDQAAAYLERGKAILDQVALPTDTNYASIAFQQGGIAEEHDDLEAAAAGFDDAVARLRPRLHGHPFLGVGLFAIAIAQGRLGHFDEAIAAVREADDLATAAQGELHPEVVRYGLMLAQLEWMAGNDAAATAALARPMRALPELRDRTDDHVRSAHHVAGWIRLAAGDLAGAERHLAVLQSLPDGSAMYGIDFARSTRRLAGSIALGRGDVAAARAALVKPIAGASVPEEYDAELERQLDAAVWTRILAHGGSPPPGVDLSPRTANDGVKRRMGVTRTAMLRTIAGPGIADATLAAAP